MPNLKTPTPKKYVIGDVGFKTKKECETYTRNIVNTLGVCSINKDHIHFQFFNNLLNNHPQADEKRGTGIDYFFIIPNPMSPKYFQTMIQRLDGSNIDFSWVMCSQFKDKTPMQNLIVAMRETISYDTSKYKRTICKQNQSKFICTFCKIETEPYENYHGDHHNPSFQT